ncbi:MAG: hypothetical protein HC808_12200 [Candidatus Competibacteraceae bacterium]|nr:hypothetical protein [Candidatus Competibacteraceae bacterium]
MRERRAVVVLWPLAGLIAGFTLLAWNLGSHAMPPLVSYHFEPANIEFRLPKNWITRVHGSAQAVSSGLSAVEQVDKADSPGLYFWTGTAPYMPKEAIYMMLRESGVTTAEPIQERDWGYSYTGLLEYRYPGADTLMRGIAFAQSGGGKITWTLFEAPVERFATLGGIALPLAAFQQFESDGKEPTLGNIWIAPNVWTMNTLIYQHALGAGFGIPPAARGVR